jgi:hydroxymethylpyrimidine/phosphomethylpyrimidine kinase
MQERTPIALTIAGSDSGGGAGIQADIKTFSALGAYGCSVITALTAQNTCGVRGILGVDPGFVRAQMDAVFEDIDVCAVKIGMLGTAATIMAVAEGLERWRPAWVVLDPVMVAKGGDRLLEADAVAALRDRLVPLASLVTPNLPEAADLLGVRVPTQREAMPDVARGVLRLGASGVLLKGGHLSGDVSPDLLMHGDVEQWFEAARVSTRNTHGTGCTLSAAIAAGLACGLPMARAVAEAKRYIEGAIAAADQLQIGHGHGPVHHFHRVWPGLS